MDMAYMQSAFHQTHYQFFYMTLPSMLRSQIFQEVLQATKDGTGNQYLVGFWRATARQVYKLPMGVPLPREIDMTRDDFSALAISPKPGMTFLVLTGPTPQGPVEAGCAVAAFENSKPFETLRYFTCEAPMEPSFPWMVGEWYVDGGRGNLGGISDISAQGMCNFVAQQMGISTTPTINRPTQAATSLGSTGRALNQISFNTDWGGSVSLHTGSRTVYPKDPVGKLFSVDSIWSSS